MQHFQSQEYSKIGSIIRDLKNITNYNICLIYRYACIILTICVCVCVLNCMKFTTTLKISVSGFLFIWMFYYLNLKQILFQRRKTLKHNLTLRNMSSEPFSMYSVIIITGLPAIMNRDKKRTITFLYENTTSLV